MINGRRPCTIVRITSRFVCMLDGSGGVSGWCIVYYGGLMMKFQRLNSTSTYTVVVKLKFNPNP